MKKIITRLFVLAFAITSFNSFSQTPNWIWAKKAGGTGSDVAYRIAADASGNTFMFGYFQSPTITFGATTLTSAGSTDVMLVKYDSNGNVVWAQSAGGTDTEIARDIVTDSAGNVYIAGYFRSATITFGSVTLTNAWTTKEDIFLFKFNTNGTALWGQRAGATLMDQPNGVAVDNAGNSYITGYFDSPSFTVGSTTLTKTGSRSIFLIKYDSNGNPLWAKTPTGTGLEQGFAIAVDGSGNAYITGNFNGNLTLGSTVLSSPGGSNVYLAKYAPTGNVLWAKHAPGNNGASGTSLAADAAGNIYISGQFASTNIAFGSYTVTNMGTPTANDAFVAKYNGSGTALWAKGLGGTGYESANSIKVDASCNVYVGGRFSSAAFVVDSYTLTNTNGTNNEGYLAKYDCSGSNIFVKQIAGNNHEEIYGITADGSGNVYACGTSDGPSVTLDTITLTLPGTSNEIFVAKIPPSCSTPNANAGADITICSGSSAVLQACGGTSYNWTPSTGLSSSTSPNPTASPTITTTYTVTSSSSCGSGTDAVTVFVNTSYHINRTDSICQGDSVLLGTKYRKTSGVYYDSLLTTKGCDSIITTSLTVLNTVYPVYLSICQGDSILLGGMYRKVTGIYSDTLTATTGCDSILLSHLGIKPSYVNSYSLTICSTDSVFLEGAYQNTTGTYYDTLTTIQGCDSVKITHLTVNLGYQTSYSVTICSSDSVFLGGAYQNTTGVYYDSLTALSGCDSVLVTNLTVNPTSQNTYSLSICTGDSVLLQGAYRKISGIFYDTLATIKGCDSVLVTNLTVGNSIINNQSAAICQGDSIFLQGAYRKTAGTYSDSLTAAFGCDSIVVTTLTVNPKPSLTLAGIIPAGCNFTNGSISVNVSSGTPAYTYAWLPSGGSTSVASSLGIGNYSVTVTDSKGCKGKLIQTLGDSCDFVWPGDANDDGVADNLDILSIGIGNGSTGAIRAGASLNWIGQPCSGWNTSLAGGTDYKHIDCNGDGTINSTDTVAVIQNYGLVHNNKLSNPIIVAATDIYTKVTVDTVGSGGSLVTVQIGLGTAAAPATNVYGVAYSLSFSNPSLVDLSSVSFTGQNSWLGTLGTDLIQVGFENALEATVTRTNHANASGNGFIHTLKFKTSNTLNGSGNSATLLVNITGATVISANETVTPVNLVSDSLVVKDTLLVTSVHKQSAHPQAFIYPNPTNGKINVQCSGFSAGQAEVLDVLGRKIVSRAFERGTLSLDLTDAPRGIYFLQVKTQGGTVTNKFTKE